MTAFTASDHSFMARALALASLGRFTAHPNPRVGCVLVRDGQVVGEGWHRARGEPHAEINALDAAGSDAKGSTAYVTLEPCSHHGRTPPCSEALLRAGVAELVFAAADPNPEVDGAERIAEAGIPVRQGLMREQAEYLNRGFGSRMRRGRPFTTLKIAASLDGATAMASGESRWITGPEARRDVQRLRAESGAILTGRGTVVADDPSLTVRDLDTGGRQPLRVVVDSALATPGTAKLFSEPGETLMLCADDSGRAALEAAGAAVERLPSAGRGVDLPAALLHLGRIGINDLLVEAGPLLAGSLLEAGLVDELVIYLAPHIMGSETRGIAETPGWHALSDRLQLDLTDLRMVGRDLRLTAKPAEPTCSPES